ncbi:carbohydrate ABC transporter membrane protein 1, CUT1 family [Paenibacillus algorifonticola]|uniref:Carbohydrate ABC transporter membrane protein 1, CUT1 family n=1 Tax=Paenibacillus algorifonticola TaxID=684063 RepID=A0A1I2AX01_9BACL|nr:sugar ABC transporter permease [Paenibacillus algorifonticola]SFE48491.1 carbohydrate ABC transporter membrane protein 1, CUT1 family [Paenibacillus algorifonticola]
MRNKIYPFYFALGTVGVYFIFFVVPGLMGFYYSLTDWNSYSDTITFIGLDNFKTLFSSGENYVSYIINTLNFTASTVILKTAIGLLFALILNEGIKLKGFHRVMIFMPSIVPMLVVGLIFKSILNPATGLLNEALRWLGLDFMAQKWLVDANWAFKSIIGVDTWKGAGYIMIILLAGLQSISRSYYEAAEIDGANSWHKFKYVTLPLLMPALVVTTVLNLLHGLKVFEAVYVLTNGGPGYATDVLYTAIFKEFSMGRYGVGTALSSLLFLFMTIVGYFVIRLMAREEGRDQ